MKLITFIWPPHCGQLLNGQRTMYCTRRSIYTRAWIRTYTCCGPKAASHRLMVVNHWASNRCEGGFFFPKGFSNVENLSTMIPPNSAKDGAEESKLLPVNRLARRGLQELCGCPLFSPSVGHSRECVTDLGGLALWAIADMTILDSRARPWVDQRAVIGYCVSRK